MTILMLWIHLMAAVTAMGGLAFLLLVLMPSLRILNPGQSSTLLQAMANRFRWVIWSAFALLLVSGLYGVRQYYWESAWGRSWEFLTVKIILALVLFGIVLGLTNSAKVFDRMRARSQTWLIVALSLGAIVILISAYLRRT
jgi:putative copper export protein